MPTEMYMQRQRRWLTSSSNNNGDSSSQDSSDDDFEPDSSSSTSSSSISSSRESESESESEEDGIGNDNQPTTQTSCWVQHRAALYMQHKADCSSDESSANDGEVDSEDDDNDEAHLVPRSVSLTQNALRRHVQFKSSLQVFPPSPLSNKTDVGGDQAKTDEAGPLSPWNDKCKSKQKIITALKDKESPIHKILDKINDIHRLYAPRYQLNRFKGYMKTIMKNYNQKKGPFKSEMEPWATRKKIKSQGYALLFTLLMNKETTGIDEVRSMFYMTHYFSY